MQILTTKPSLICNILYTILGFFLFITFSREGEGRGHKTLLQTRGMFGKHMLRGFKWPPGRLHFKEFSTFKLGFYDDVPLRSTLG